jgi:hypothetical protein
MEVLEPQVETIRMDIVKLNVTDVEIKKLKDDFLPLVINGVEDKAGLKKVYESRQIVKKTRVGLVKYADELKEKAIAWQRKVNAEKNRVVGELELIESHLQGEEDRIEAEKEQIRLEAEQREQQRIQCRIDTLAQYGFAIDLNFLKSLADEDFQKVVDNAKLEHEKELAAKAEAERLQRLEAEKLQREREELERLRKHQAEAQRIIDENNERVRLEQEAKEEVIRKEAQRIENEKRELELQKQREEARKIREQELEQARIEAAENARLQAIEDQKRLLEQKAEAERQAKILEAEKLAQSSDKVKFTTVIEQLNAITIPEMKSAKAKKLSIGVQELIGKVVAHIKTSI